jgi:signal transduction histidine kinase
LGLAICRGLVEAHGGRIWIKKQASIGTTISFTIPLVTPNHPSVHQER